MDVASVRQSLDGLRDGDARAATVLRLAVTQAAEGSVADAAALVAEIGRARLRDPQLDEIPAFADLLDRARAALDRAVALRSAEEDVERNRTLADEVLDEVRAAPLSPGALADRLQVHISQISRAGRALLDAGRLDVVRDPTDRRRRLYSRVGVAHRPYNLSELVVPVLSELDFASVRSDLVPDRLGDRFEPGAQERVLAAVAEELETGQYEPVRMHTVRIAKQGGGTRPGAAPSFTDRAVFAALVERCRGPISEVLQADESVLWPKGYPSPKRWRDLEHFAKSSNLPYVLSVDIQSFYETVRHDVLADRLLSANCEPSVVNALTTVLDRMVGKNEGLPQGLEPSDPLAGIILAPLDRTLHENSIPFVRHGDDLRCAVRTASAADEVVSLIRDRLEALELLVNDAKTRTLTRDNYLEARTSIRRAVEALVVERGTAGAHRLVQELLAAMDADEELQWGWYHGNLTISDVLDLGRTTMREDSQAMVALLDSVLTDQLQHDAFRSALHEPGSRFLARTGLQLMADLRLRPPAPLPIELLTEPDYDDVLPAYLSALAEVDPETTRALLDRIDNLSDQDGLWLRLYQGIHNLDNTEFDGLAVRHTSAAKDPAVRVRAARFLTRRQRPDLPQYSVVDTAPAALRADALSTTPDFDRTTETPTTLALVEAA